MTSAVVSTKDSLSHLELSSASDLFVGVRIKYTINSGTDRILTHHPALG